MKKPEKKKRLTTQQLEKATYAESCIDEKNSIYNQGYDVWEKYHEQEIKKLKEKIDYLEVQLETEDI